ncbi:MAG: hypothetical protein P8182_09305 [Deltaproteobacteria bacterium]
MDGGNEKLDLKHSLPVHKIHATREPAHPVPRRSAAVAGFDGPDAADTGCSLRSIRVQS